MSARKAGISDLYLWLYLMLLNFVIETLQVILHGDYGEIANKDNFLN